jgi:hypothetical protein
MIRAGTKLLALAAATVVFCSLAVLPVQAGSPAESPAGAAPATGIVYVPMKAVPANQATIDRVNHRVMVNGQPVMPYDTRYGNCGYSWYYNSGGFLHYYHNTGFHIWSNWPPATGYDWEANVVGPYGYDRDFHWGGGLFFRHDWTTGTRGFPVDDSGYFDGKVTFGLAYLVGGLLCFSAHPHDRTFVY